MTQKVDDFIEENSDFVKRLRSQITTTQDMLSGYAEIFMRIKDIGSGFDLEFEDMFEKHSSTVNRFVKLARIRITKLLVTESQNKETYEISLKNE